MRRFILLVIVITFGVAIFGPIVRGLGQDRPAAKAAEPPARARTELDKLMQQKLQRAQRVLEGLANNDPAVIKQNAQDLLTLSKTAEFRVLKTPQYDLHSNEFRRSLDDMVKGAGDRNVDAATLAYLDMVLACMRCHKHVREVRITLGPRPPVGFEDSMTELGE